MHRNDLIEIAKTQLVPPGEFGERNFSGPDDIGETHMLSITKSRDSDALARSNFSVISTDMLARFPGDCRILHSSHWAVGWVEQLVVRVLTTDYKPALPVDWKFTEAFEAIMEWSNALHDYPVADDMDYSETEHEELIEYIGNVSYESTIEIDGVEVGYEYIDKLPDDHAERIASWLFDNREDVRTPDDVLYEDIETAARELGLTVPDIAPLVEEIGSSHRRINMIQDTVLDIDRGIANMDDLKNLLREDS